ncbi:methyltransferase domain-containing protein [Phyllobacterium pellucidum]|uniref:methyltransferase domain-containing protein n=1 Tax=Phyllobacterium pellucidum TaxID=2740464 RepID=UPI001D146BF3|nr:methyltransferase domain-containing protein [Phyllobacterium sp. T1018]UGY10673.1 methyltransferase domain-containing protein [Phyllobacterium sp. T1018]
MSYDCPICAQTVNEKVVEVEGYTIFRCHTCATEFVAPPLRDNKLFDGSERDVHNDEAPEWLVPLIDKVEEQNPNPSILDIGCVCGTRLALAQQRGWQCFGVEPSPHAREIAQQRHKGIFITETIEEIPPHKFDLILILEVIEHLSDPYPLFYEMFAKGQIGPDTVVAVTTANARSWTALADPIAWELRPPPSHMTSYSGLTFKTLLKRLRFRDIDVEGQHPLNIAPVRGFDDEDRRGNEKLAGFAGLKVIATGSDFSSFMQERYVPGTWSELTAYEHLPRYMFAQQYSIDRRVLDFGCGSGYGAKALSEVADHVVAVDIDDGALEYARTEHSRFNLEFVKVDDLCDNYSDAQFDLVTCFEVIEHLDELDQKRLLKNFRRLLKPQGLLIISTPNPKTTELYGENPFHLKEMELDEFSDVLKANFKHTIILDQKILSGSTLTISSDNGASNPAARIAPMYTNVSPKAKTPAAWIALCSMSPLDRVQPVFFYDNETDFIRQRVREIATRHQHEIKLYTENKQSAELERALLADAASLQGKYEHLRSTHDQFVEERDRISTESASLQQRYEALVEERDKISTEAASLQQRYEGLVEERDKISTEAASLQQRYEALVEERAALRSRLHTIETSLRWRLANRLARHAPFLRAALANIRQLRAVLKQKRPAAASSAPAVPLHKPVAYETACEPQWNAKQNRYELLVDEAYRAKQEAKTGTLQGLVAPYVVRPKNLPEDPTSLPKVLHVIPNVHVGGSTQLIIDIVEHLSDQFQHEVVTLALWPAGQHVGLTVHQVTYSNMQVLQSLLKEMRPDLVHIHYWGLTDDLWYKAVMEQLEDFQNLPIVENINTPIDPLISPRINRYVFVSEYVRKEFGGKLSDKLATVVYPGIDLTRFSHPYDGEDAENAIGMVYRLEKDKLTIDAIDLFIEVVKRRPRTRVYIIGGGSFLEAWINRTYAQGVRQNFRFTGYVPYEELPDWYNRFSIFIAPVWAESFGQVAPFAMSKRLAIAGYRIGALPEIAGSDEFFGTGVEDTAKIIIDLLEDKERCARIGLENQKRAASLFSVEAMVSAYQHLYKEELEHSKD